MRSNRILKLLFIIVLANGFIACSNGPDCNSMDTNFTSYRQATELVRSANGFEVSEKERLNSTWIKSAEYYSCDGDLGYFIYSTAKGDSYIHQDLPLDKWEAFIAADSHGKYYHRFIKGKYTISSLIE